MKASCPPGLRDHGNQHPAVEAKAYRVLEAAYDGSPKKASTCSRAPKGIPLETIINGIATGTLMYKIRSGSQFYFRQFYVDVQNMRLHYKPSRKLCRRTENYIDIHEIHEVRKGWNTDPFNSLRVKLKKRLQATLHRRLCLLLCERNCFSIIIGPSHETWDIVSPNEETRNAWVRGINHLIATNRNVQRQQEYDRWLMEQVKNADINGNGSLNLKECLTLLKQMNISMDKKHGKALFEKANFHKNKIDGEDALDGEEFVVFFHSLISRPEVEELMKRYSVGNSMVLESEQLHAFLTKEQKINYLTIEDCEAIIEKYEPDTEKLKGYMTLRGFREMLLSKDFDIFNHDHCVVHQDMSYPLSYYYIASSHNTYLVQGQLIGDSSVEGYIQALLRGCRCVELDVWDGPDDDPVVFHGYTLTSKILFSDILDSIKKYAFKKSQFPVILSIENHCSVSQQKKLAQHLIDILGDLLYRQPVGKEETCLPSPVSLANKIIVKGKKHNDESDIDIVQESSDEEEEQSDELIVEDGWGRIAAPKKLELAKELSDLVNYCKSSRFHSFEEVKEKWKFNEMASFEETKSSSFASNKIDQFIEYNKTHLSRIYPSGLRTGSSNYDPVPHWNAGCQMVALNYQTFDREMLIYSAKFQQNGQCGYVLKPDFLCKNNSDSCAIVDDVNIQIQKYMKITVISGQHIPKPGQSLEGEIVDPYVKIKVFGHATDVQKFRTKHVHNNGFNPVWNEVFVLKFHIPELASVVFTVKDQSKIGKNLMLAQYAIPFTSITEGYRHIHLLDDIGQPVVPASLFVHISISTFPST